MARYTIMEAEQRHPLIKPRIHGVCFTSCITTRELTRDSQTMTSCPLTSRNPGRLPRHHGQVSQSLVVHQPSRLATCGIPTMHYISTAANSPIHLSRRLSLSRPGHMIFLPRRGPSLQTRRRALVTAQSQQTSRSSALLKALASQYRV